MPVRKCFHCESRFSKIEHLKRHERSHTGEKPYQCPQCKKSFSRGDVLSRHVKGHLSRTKSAPPAKPMRSSQPHSSDEAPLSHPHSPLIGNWPSTPPLSARESVPPPPNGRSSLKITEFNAPDGSNTSPDFDPNSLWVFPTSQDNNGIQASSLDDLLNIEPSTLPVISPSDPWDRAITDAGKDMDLEITQSNLSSGNRNPSNSAAALSGAMVMPATTYESGRLRDVTSQDPIAWMDFFDYDSIISNVMSISWTPRTMETSPLPPRTFQITPRRKYKLGKDIPDEMFAKMARQWSRKMRPPWRLMSTLWLDVVTFPKSNIFSEFSSDEQEYSIDEYGLDEEERMKLIQDFMESMDTQIDGGLNEERFPPADTLDICVDLYFRRFYFLMPFIHRPTFAPGFCGTI